MHTEKYRAQFIDRIMKLFEEKSWMLGIWEGGSAATGFLDDLSDLDISFVVEDDKVQETFSIFEEMLEREYGIKSRLRIPEPAWHGHSQCYYFIHNCPEHFYVDVLVEKKSAESRLMEPDRHGKSRILLNRDNILKPEPVPAEELLEKNRNFFRFQRDCYPISETETAKQLIRGNRIDAMLEYQGFVQRRLAALLNLKYRRAKYDFGIRYGDREYPPEVAERLKYLLYAESLEEIEPRFKEASAWGRKLIRELQEILG